MRLQPAQRGFESFHPCRPVTKLVYRPGCRPGETGSIPVQGASSCGRAARHPSDTRVQVGSTPAGWTLSSWSSGVLATLTWWRPVVQIHPRAFGPVVQRRRRLAHIQATMVRVHPGSLRGRLERFQQGLISPSTRVRFPLPQLSSSQQWQSAVAVCCCQLPLPTAIVKLGAHVPRRRGCLASNLRWVRFPSSPLW